MKFGIANTFINSLEKLSKDEKKGAKLKAFELQMNPANPGMQFHRVDGRDPNFWSIRVNNDIRIIVHKTNNEMLVCYVDHHDPAYQLANRRRMDRHPNTGVAQIIETQEIVEEITIPKYIESQENISSEKSPESSLFNNVLDETLLSYGVPEEQLDKIRNSNEDTFLEIASHLKQETAEILLELAFGGIHTIINVEELERTIKWMDKNELERSLRSIGKACFVNYYEKFSSKELSNNELIQLLVNEKGYAEKASRTRVSQSRRIINAGMVVDALTNILNSNRLGDITRNKAGELLNRLK